MDTLYYIGASLFLIWVGLSPVVWFHWQSRGWEPTGRLGWSMFFSVLATAFLGVYLLLYLAFGTALFLVLPYDRSPRRTIAGCLSLLGGLAFLWFCDRMRRLRIEEEDRKRLAEEQGKARPADWQRSEIRS